LHLILTSDLGGIEATANRHKQTAKTDT